MKTPLIALFALAGFAFSTPASACDFDQVVFDAEFEGGKLSQCQQHSPERYTLTTVAEDYPINPSPWYAFTVQSKDSAERVIQVALAAEKGRARYVPKVSYDRKNWQTIPFNVVDNVFQFELTVTDQPLYVAGQELFTEQDYQSWMKTPALQQRFTQKVIGESREGREIVALEATQPDNKEWLLVIGRQHPPELTGAFGLLAFVEQLIADGQLQQSFFERFNVLVVPLMNPDGVVNGNWRHNMGGRDLNRDWGNFEHPETKAVHDYLQRLTQGDQRLVFALDFHSTQQDIFYTQAAESPAVPADFVTNWLAALKANTVSSYTLRERASYNPESTVFSHYIVREYGVHAVTYEWGDNTERQLIRHVAAQSAIELQQLMLATPASAFIVVEPQ